MYKRTGLSSSESIIASSMLLLGWITKPLWRPFLDTMLTRKIWVVLFELFICITFYYISQQITTTKNVADIIGALIVFSLSGATHSVCVENYLIEQIGRTFSCKQRVLMMVSTLFAFILVGGVLIMFAGNMEVITRKPLSAWGETFFILAIITFCLCLFHAFLLRKSRDRQYILFKLSFYHWNIIIQNRIKEIRFFQIITPTLLILPLISHFFIAQVFFIERISYGGLGFSPQDYAFSSGTIGSFALITGLFSGQKTDEKIGLKITLLIASTMLTLSPLVMAFISMNRAMSLFWLTTMIIAWYFLIGFGANTINSFIREISSGKYSSAERGIILAVTAFISVILSVCSAWWQETLGYYKAFSLSTILGIISIITAIIAYNKSEYEN